MAQEIADSTLLDTWGSSGAKIEPDISKIIEGWQLGEQPPHEYMNWLQNTFGSKLNHILKNGVASWNNTTQYLAGSSVQHTGNVWLCKTTNTNSEPTDANANWKRIITVESLTALLVGYVDTASTQTIGGVKTFSSSPLSTASQSTNSNALTKYSAVVKNTGNETIAGVKTFSSSPIVPTPTTGTQAVNKDYADLKVALTSFIGTNQSLTLNGYQKLPGGLIIQWLIKPNLIAKGQHNFPITFPNGVMSILGTHSGGNGVSPGVIQVYAVDTSKFGWRMVDVISNGDISGSIYFIAIGY